jgi:3-oxoacyl-[acyl-carrier protein] reductase
MTVPDPAPLAGSVAVVTGSARNIGRGIALMLAAQGAAVVINARTSKADAEAAAAEIASAGGRAHVCLADVSNAADAARLIASAVGTFGRLDILVNNVGQRCHTAITETSDEDWHRVLASILDGTFYCTRAAVPHLAASGRGAVVNIGGVSGHAGVTNRTAVATAKAGLAGFTGALAIELAPRNITVNCVAPGHIRTSHDGGLPPHFKARQAALGRPGTVDEVAATVAFLCGPGGHYITGETIHVNGGWYVTIA